VGIDGSDPQRPMPLVGDGLGVLSRYPISDVERVPWPRCFGGADTSDGGAGDCLAMKGFLVASVELAPGVAFDLYTLHVEAGEGPDDQPLQEEDMATLAAFMAERSAGRGVIIAGDTNLHLEPGHDQEPPTGPSGRASSTSWVSPTCAPPSSARRRAPSTRWRGATGAA
jgi:hypothetical protein